MKKICCIPACNKEIPEWRKKAGMITCSKKCSREWNWMSGKKREEIRGKKYGTHKEVEDAK